MFIGEQILTVMITAIVTWVIVLGYEESQRRKK